jgi:protocatechuate 3,4-dioxygenase beta subunit
LFLGGLAAGAALLSTRGLFAADPLAPTPAQTEGPFYPDKLPLDTDNDLLVINDGTTSLGEITHLTGRILDKDGKPIKNAVVEIWQCDAKGVYIHTNDSGPREKTRDKNFQGFGRFVTNANGEYYFRTIKPVPYPGRPAPHIHYKIKRGGKELLVTQCYIKGDPQNEKDGIFRAVRDAKVRDAILVDFTPIKESKIGEFAAKFDVILGVTPEM